MERACLHHGKQDVAHHVKYKFRNRDSVSFFPDDKNRNKASVSLYTNGHVMAAQLIGK